MNAIFCFTVVKKISQPSLSVIISKAVTVAETSYNFSQFRVYLEEGSAQQIVQTQLSQMTIGTHEGIISLVSVRQVQMWLDQKRLSEERARTQPGHTSYRPPDILATDTCVIVIGSRAFCAVMARIHMEEIAALRLKLIDILTGICSLATYSARTQISVEDILIASVKPDEKDHITYNLNWMADQVMKHASRLSEDEVRKRLT